ncbi:MAG: DNA polymerase III subunit delta [Christensenellales bacterium]|nr:DNA polymerase III subunit delta [Christensenellales bacterium]
MNQWAFFDELKAGTVRRVYLFYGPEAYIRKSARTSLEKKVLMPGLESMNCTVLSAPTAQAIIESCETLPLMSDYRLIVVQDCALLENGKAKDEAQESELLCDYLPRVPETTCLLFEASGTIDKRKKLTKALLAQPGAVSFDALDDTQLARWIAQTLRPMGKRMDRAACDALAFTSGRDLTMLHGELEKLAAYAGERETITAQDVEQVATHTAESTVFAMVDALSAGKAEQAFALLGVLLSSGEQRIGILAMITRHYRQMMHLCAMQADRVPTAQAAKVLGVPPFAMTRLSKQVGRRPYEALKACVALCVQTDYDIKRGALREEAALDRLMLTLAGQA